MNSKNRNLILRPFWAVAVATALVGCIDIERPAPDEGWKIFDEPSSEQPATPPAPVVTDDPTRPTTTPARPVSLLDPSSCALESSSSAVNWWIEPRFSGFTPNEGLFVSATGYNGSGVTMSVALGEAFDSHTAWGLSGVDDAWSVGFFERPYGVFELRAMESAEILASVEGYVVASTVSPDGVLAAAALCSGEATSIELIDVPNRFSRTIELTDQGGCYGWSASMNRLMFTADHRYLLVTTVSGELWSLDTRTLDTVGIAPHENPDGESYYDGVISDVTVRPGAAEVVTTGIDGVMRRWSLPGLQQVGDDVEVGTFLINENTYAPRYTVSPVAFAPDGQTIAWVNADGNIVIENAEGRAVLESLPVPEEIAEWEHTPSVPVTLVFAPSGERLGVGYTYGHGIWGCPGPRLQRGGEIRLIVPETFTGSFSEQANIPVQLEGAAFAALRARTVDGEPVNAHFSDGVMSMWSPGAPGEQTIVVEADDGHAVATATVHVRFTQ